MGCTLLAAARSNSGNPTAGFEKVVLADGDFQVQSPSNVPESQRFQYRNGVRTFWVHRNDKPINTATHTNPRSEVKLRVSTLSVTIYTSATSKSAVHGLAHIEI